MEFAERVKQLAHSKNGYWGFNCLASSWAFETYTVVWSKSAGNESPKCW